MQLHAHAHVHAHGHPSACTCTCIYDLSICITQVGCEPCATLEPFFAKVADRAAQLGLAPRLSLARMDVKRVMPMPGALRALNLHSLPMVRIPHRPPFNSNSLLPTTHTSHPLVDLQSLPMLLLVPNPRAIFAHTCTCTLRAACMHCSCTD